MRAEREKLNAKITAGSLRMTSGQLELPAESCHIILFSGGMDTKYSEIKPVAVPGIILATLGVMLTALLTGGLIYCISGILTGVPSLTFTESLLLALSLIHI